ncbi:MAG: serine/threonine protein phosphatase, partial [Verrucomicrobiaceae bacterium]|nr:serine/threonine protein phosphatase [Verrucomicrobiaceae bacterium]
MKIRSTAYGIAYDKGKPSSDVFAVRESGQTVVAVLCDGAGTGAPAREAAERAVRSVTENYWAKPRTWLPQRALSEFTHLINRTLHEESMARFDRVEMVATLAAAVIEGDRLYGINVGDSRVCVLRDGRLIQLSQDHVSKEQSHVLTRALGLEQEVQPHAFESPIGAGDVVVLCSDGVSNHFTHETMGAALKKCASARTLVTDARSRAVAQSLDDMSAIVLDVAETGKLHAMNDRQLSIPEALRKGEVIDGYQLVRPFQNADRVWLADKDG